MRVKIEALENGLWHTACSARYEQSLSPPSPGGGLPGTTQVLAQAVRAAITLPLVDVVVPRLHRRHIRRPNSHLPLTLHDFAA
jgi:hypothetical protein